jgi:cytoskeleton protein RodZ
MSLTLGEKLRQAREERGLSISEVAEQTRISALYLESIENNDFKPLPGGIFNKGFVKSYAKFVGIDEQEALQDYAAIMAQQGDDINDEPKTFRSEVLTDEGSRYSLLPTILFSIIILGLMVWGIMAFLRYYTGDESQTVVDANANKTVNANTQPTPTPTPTAISITDAKIEFKPVNEPLWVGTTIDGKKLGGIIPTDKPTVYEPKENLRISYAKVQAQNAQLTINGKQITLPSAPANPKLNTIDLEITKDNINQIYQSGEIK